MKKKIFLLALGFMSFGAFAQFESGTFQATGGLNFSSGSTETDGTDQSKTSGFGIQLMGGYFVVDRLSVGLGIGFESGKNTLIDAGVPGEDLVIKSNMFMISPYARYYFPYTDRFAAFGQFSFAYGTGSMTMDDGSGTEQKTDISALNVGISPGFNYFLTETFALEMTYGFLGYTQAKSSQEIPTVGTTETTAGEFGLNLDLNTINFGFTLFF